LRWAAKIVCVAAALFAPFPAAPLSAGDTAVYLDPGHGGQDAGAKGASGLLEKDVALALAKRIDTKLGHQYSVRLSRSDDYGLDPFPRAETANSQKADVYISLHTGGAFNYSSGGLTVYYYLDSPGRIFPEGASDDLSSDATAGRTSWYSVQYRHAAESRLLAQLLQPSLAGLVGTSSCRTLGLPLLALSSADMPAVLIEVGCLNNPSEEEKLADPDYLDKLAEAISRGIENYLGRTSDITSMDLRE